MNTCKNCGKVIDDSYKFCVHCGTSCQESMDHEEELDTKNCPECGRSIGIFCKFCVYCGAKCQTEISLKNLFWNVDAYQWLPQIVRQLVVLEDRLRRRKKDTLYDYVIHSIKTLKNLLAAPPQVMIVGSFSTGKSTFLNALFGEAIAKVGALPTTAITTKLSYGSEDTLLVYFKNGDIEKYGVDDFERLTSETGEEWQTLHNSILYVERFLPNELLKNFSIIDSPGLDAKVEHTNQTKNFIERADVILWMFSAEHAVSAREVAAIKELDSRYKPVAIINKIDTLDEEEDDLDDLLDSLKGKLNNLVSGIYPISAQLAFQGKESQNKSLLEESLITHLESYLNNDVIATSENYRMQLFLDTFSILIFAIADKAGETGGNNYLDLFRMLIDFYEECQEAITLYSQNILENEIHSLDMYKAAKELLFVSQRDAIWATYSESSHFQALCAYLIRAARGEHPIAIFLLAVLSIFNSESEEARSFFESTKQWIDILEDTYSKDATFLDNYDIDGLVSEDELSSQTAIEIILSTYYRNRDSSRHVYYLKLASSHGSYDAKFTLAMHYESCGKLIEAKPYWEELLSQKNDMGFAAYNNLGLLYIEGTEEIPKDLVKATQYLSIASQSGNPESIRNYAEVLLRRANEDPSSNEAKEWEYTAVNLLESVRNQSPLAAETLMGIYMQGLSCIEPSHKKAFEIFKQTYEPTDTMRFLMAQIYLSGQYGGPQDCIKALAVSQPLAPAERLYIEGVVAHIQNNMEQARISLQKSADLGFEPAKEDLKNGLDTITYGGTPSNKEQEEDGGGFLNLVVGVCIAGGIIIAFPAILIIIAIILIIWWVWRKKFS